MALEEGKLYNVFGRHIYGAGSTKKRVTEIWDKIMYVQDEETFGGRWKANVFLADGDQHGGLIDKDILTRIKIPLKRYRLIGSKVITNKVLDKSSIFLKPDEHSDGIIRFLTKAEEFAERLLESEKKERYQAMIRSSLYEEYREEKIGNVVVITKKDPVLRDLMHKTFGLE